jgi:hypothetical protein
MNHPVEEVWARPVAERDARRRDRPRSECENRRTSRPAENLSCRQQPKLQNPELDRCSPENSL